jgi:elongation factor P--(R)-beta-lysine ligase
VVFGDESARLSRIKSNLERRALIFQLTRAFFGERGFLEVDTPVRVPAVAPEQFIRPFASEDWFLSTSPELHMKRLLASGYDRVFQVSRCFRKGEIGRRHNSEFTMLEWYRRDSGYAEMVSDTAELVASLVRQLGLGGTIPYLGMMIDLSLPWPQVSVSDAFVKAAGWDPVADPDTERFDLDLVGKVIPGFDPGRPVILAGYPAPMAALARLNVRDRGVAERAEVFVGGLELANAYTELNDPDEQRRRFEAEAKLIRQAGGRAPLPGRFLEAVAHLPQCAGIALGMDRLVMLLCNTDAIQDVMAFPQDEA